MVDAPAPPLRVLLAGHCRSPISLPFAGGLEAVTWQLARGLVARGHEVSLFAAAGSDCGPGVTVISPEDLGVRVDPDAPWDDTREDVNRAHHRLADHLPVAGLDLVHNNSLNPTLLERDLGLPVTTSLHTPPLLPMMHALRRFPPAPGSVNAVSAFTAHQWRRVVDASVVHNGVDGREWPAGPGGDALVWFGRLVPEKGPDVAIAMARRLGLPLRLVGPRSDAAFFADHLRPMLGGGIEYLGHLGTSELAEVVGSSAATLVTPQWDEPFGLIAAESGACGTPVIGLTRGGLPEVVSPEVGRLLPPTDWETGLVSATREALGLDRTLVRRTVLRRFGIDAMVSGYETRYRRLLRVTGPVEAAQ
ncbi:glycosyltransferase [Kytococcus sp. Marseille-QA3725]